MNTKEYTIDKDIQLCTVEAASFPAGIQDAFVKLGAAIPPGSKMWGLSRPEADGGIMYRAAAEAETPDAPGFQAMTIAKGKYLGMEIHDFMSNIQQIGAAFQLLLHSPGLDPKGYCVERYVSDKDVICMVKVND